MRHIQNVNGSGCTIKNFFGCSQNAFCCENDLDPGMVWSVGPNVCRYRDDCGLKLAGVECVCNEIVIRFKI